MGTAKRAETGLSGDEYRNSWLERDLVGHGRDTLKTTSK